MRPEAALYFFVAWLPVYLQEGRHFSETEMKAITSALFIVGAISALIAGYILDWLVKWTGLRNGRRISGVTAVGIMALLFILAAYTRNNNLAILSFFIANFFLWNSIVCSASVCVDIGGQRTATPYGLMNFVGQIGAFFLAVAFGKIVDATHNFQAPLYLTAILLFGGSLLWSFIKADKPLFDKTKTNPVGSHTFRTT
jgi:sugar phosphate permease